MGIIKDLIRKAMPGKTEAVQTAPQAVAPVEAKPSATERADALRQRIASKRSASDNRFSNALANMKEITPDSIQVVAKLHEGQGSSIAIPDDTKQAVQEIMAKLGLHQRDSSTSSQPAAKQERFASVSVQEGAQLSLVPNAKPKTQEAGISAA